jgi:predicted O-methyltransferase YrrM
MIPSFFAAQRPWSAVLCTALNFVKIVARSSFLRIQGGAERRTPGRFAQRKNAFLLSSSVFSASLWLVSSFFSPLLAALSQPYDTVDVMPFNPQGWYQNSAPMERLLKAKQAKTVVEVGCWLGLSTRHIARTIPEDGIVYAVDHWLGSPNEDNTSYDIDNLYRQFLSNVIHEKLTHKIVPIRMASVDAAETLKVVPDLVYIDATHAYNTAYQDMTLWFPFVKGHGTLCGDDFLWGDDLPVQRAARRFAEKHNLILHSDGWFWWMEER